MSSPETEEFVLDFNIQRLGFWCSFNQKSEFTEADWNQLKLEKFPQLMDKRFIGIKYGKDGVNVAMSIAFQDKRRTYIC